MVGKVRNRPEAAKKAAETNKKKDPNYYPSIGALGGAAVVAAKKAFSFIPGLAARAGRARHNLAADQGTIYIVHGEKPSGSSTIAHSYTERTRAAARKSKKLLQFYKYNVVITRQIYDDDTGLIVESKVIM